MRYRLMATYLGVPYHAGLGPDGNEATLFSPAPPPDELGFTAAGGYWRKQVLVTDLGALWQSRLVGEYRGEPCLVLGDPGDRLHIAYLGRDSLRARQLGYWEIDREVFEVVVARQEITGLTEERVEYPLSSAVFPAPSVTEQAGPPRVVPWPGPQPGAGPGSHREAGGGYARGGGYGEPGGYADRASSTPDRMAAWHGSPEPAAWGEPGPRTEPVPWDEAEPWGALAPSPLQSSPLPAGRRDRVPQSVFAELLGLAAIPPAAYAVDEEIPGAMCLVKADGGFEVFGRTDDARLDVRFFQDEEAAYFYLFGVLAAEAVRSGRLQPGTPNGQVNGSRGPGVSVAPRETFRSTYGAPGKLPTWTSCPAIVNQPAGLTVPRSPSSPVGLLCRQSAILGAGQLGPVALGVVEQPHDDRAAGRFPDGGHVPHHAAAAIRGPRPCADTASAIPETDSETETEHQDQYTSEWRKRLKSVMSA